jgi:nitrogen fixation/metabolism regulation signal transduction histidine kinase
MKRMVDDFRDYAKAPPAVLSPLDLNALIEEILNLYLSERRLRHHPSRSWPRTCRR